MFFREERDFSLELASCLHNIKATINNWTSSHLSSNSEINHQFIKSLYLAMGRIVSALKNKQDIFCKKIKNINCMKSIYVWSYIYTIQNSPDLFMFALNSSQDHSSDERGQECGLQLLQKIFRHIAADPGLLDDRDIKNIVLEYIHYVVSSIPSQSANEVIQ